VSGHYTEQLEAGQRPARDSRSSQHAVAPGPPEAAGASGTAMDSSPSPLRKSSRRRRT